jgi:hypothetical protein
MGRSGHLLRAFGFLDHVNSHGWPGKGRGLGPILRKARPPHSSPLCRFLVARYLSLHLQWDHNALWYALFAMNFSEVFQVGVRALAFCGPWQSKSSSISFGLSWLFSPRIVLRCTIALMVLAPILRGMAAPFLHDHSAIYCLMPFRMDLLASGALLAVLWLHPGTLVKWRRWGLALMGVGFSLLVLCTLIFPRSHAERNTILFNTLGYSLICSVSTGLLAFTLGSDEGWWMKKDVG